MLEPEVQAVNDALNAVDAAKAQVNKSLQTLINAATGQMFPAPNQTPAK